MEVNPVLEPLMESLQYSFFQRAFIIGILIAISSAVLGNFLVLRKYSLVGDGLAHVSFASVAIALVLDQSPLLFSIPFVSLASVLILYINEKTNIYGDAAIGLVSSFALALGYVVINSSKSINVSINNYLFGSIITTSQLDLILSILLTLIVVFSVLFYYYPLFSITYDEEFARVTVPSRFANYLMAILTSLTIILGIRMIGVMLISSLIIFPTVTALQLTKGFKQTIVSAILISVLAVISGLSASILFNTSPGASIVLANGALFALAYAFRQFKGGHLNG